jgi:hypothetical protein
MNARMKKAPTEVEAQFSQPRRDLKVTNLLQRRVDARELGVEGWAEAIDGSNDGKADARCDQAIFNRGSRRFVVQKFEKYTRQSNLLVLTDKRRSPAPWWNPEREKLKLRELKS